MRGDKEMGPIVTAQNVEEEGMSRDGDANTGREPGSGEFGAGEPGGAGECGEHGETMLEVHQTPSTVHCGHQQGWGPM